MEDFKKFFIRFCESSKRTAIATPRKNRNAPIATPKNYLFKLKKKIKRKEKRKSGNINKNTRNIGRK